MRLELNYLEERDIRKRAEEEDNLGREESFVEDVTKESRLERSLNSEEVCSNEDQLVEVFNKAYSYRLQ